MSDWLPESLLEMHFHSALINHYAKIHGAKFMRLYKPVPQKEAWVGFDQGWTCSDLTENELFNELKNNIRNSGNLVNKFYLGVFLQFKVVDIVSRRSEKMPTDFSTPYYRSALSLKPNKSTGISQHETLLRLNKIKNATVMYACGMIFSQNELWEPPDISKLQFVDINSAPIGWATNERHHIAFKNPKDPKPQWCSEPTEGLAFGIEERFEQNRVPLQLTGESALDLIKSAAEAVSGVPKQKQFQLLQRESNFVRYLPECFSLIEFEGIL